MDPRLTLVYPALEIDAIHREENVR